MSFPPPPGTNSLPARPPASNNKSTFKPAFAFTPSSVAKQKQPQPSYSAGATSSAAPPQGYGYGAQQPQHGASYQSYPAAGGAVRGAAANSYGQQPHGYSAQPYSAAPQIHNPFPIPGTAAAASASTYQSSNYDPEMAAQIAQWQSAYVPRDAVDKDGKPITPEIAKPADGPVDRQKTVMREGGGKKWSDDTLLEWDPSHLRLFIGNLAGETTDESLLKAFSRWPSVQKARVIREKRTNKSKGYGFVSFSDTDDFFQAAKEMNGKYIQSHPVTVRKANTEIKVSNVKDKNYHKNKKNRGGNDRPNNGQGSHHGAKSGSGVTKPGQKTKNGLKLLG